MTGYEHYEEAERILRTAGEDHDAVIELLAEAQVHATLALAAATIAMAECTIVPIVGDAS